MFWFKLVMFLIISFLMFTCFIKSMRSDLSEIDRKMYTMGSLMMGIFEGVLITLIALD